MVLRVRMIERQSRAREGRKLCPDLRLELTAYSRREEVLHARAQQIGFEFSIRADQAGDRFGRRRRAPVHENQVQSHAQRGHTPRAGDRIGRSRSGDHQTRRRKHALAMPALDRFVYCFCKSEVIRRDDEFSHAPEYIAGSRQCLFNIRHGVEKELESARAGTPARKADHVRINLEHDVRAKGIDTGFAAYRLIHRALPGIDLADVNTGSALFGRRLRAPIVISCMTGGTPQAAAINRTLAQTAQEHGFAMGLGSGRALLEHPELLETFDVRRYAPGVPLLANMGAVQLNNGYGVADCRRLVEMLQADALVLHLNPLQEALQPEGDTCFRALLDAVAALCRDLDVPVAVKEVGWGIDAQTARALFDAGVSAVDVAGAGGTSWSEVERHRIAERWRANAAAAFAGWGIPTAQALRAARTANPDGTIIASGGIEGGIDVVKAIALGADAVGIGARFLHAAAQGEQACGDLAKELREVLRIAMFSLGECTIAGLRRTDRIVDDRAR